VITKGVGTQFPRVPAPLHPCWHASINAEQGDVQAASTVFQVSGVAGPGFEVRTSPTCCIQWRGFSGSSKRSYPYYL